MQDEPSPNPQYDFILNNDKKVTSESFSVTKLPKPVLFGGVLIGIMVLVIIVAVALKGAASNNQAMIRAIGHGQEITRVSVLVSAQTRDADTQNLAATVDAVLNSQQQQLTAYSLKNKSKVGVKDLAAYTNNATDAQLQTAAQNGKLESFYASYLKSNLNQYSLDLKNAEINLGPSGMLLIDSANSSVKTLLSAPQLPAAS
jgi:hypothetical protein